MGEKSLRTVFVFFFFMAVFMGSDGRLICAAKNEAAVFHGVMAGMPEAEFLKKFPKQKARTYRKNGSDEWITYGETRGEAGGAKTTRAVTFHLQGGKVLSWRFNDRDEIVEEYLGEFCSRAFIHGIPKVYAAIKNVLSRIPDDVFFEITDRRRPVLFTEYYDEGTARFANTAEITVLADDPPTFGEGLTIVKLGTALEAAPTPDAIGGVVAHELAHRFLDHGRKDHVTCAEEREANRLVKVWGFKKEYEAARTIFGHQPGAPVSCREK